MIAAVLALPWKCKHNAKAQAAVAGLFFFATPGNYNGLDLKLLRMAAGGLKHGCLIVWNRTIKLRAFPGDDTISFQFTR
jgi:hypothetical protein